MAIVFNISGRSFATFPIYYFMILAAIIESIYIAEQHGNSTFSEKPGLDVEEPLADATTV